MKSEDKIGLKIQQLQSQSDYQKFEYSRFSQYYLGGLAILVAFTISALSNNKNLILLLISVFTIGVFAIVFHIWFEKASKERLKKVKMLSRKIDALYKSLLDN